MVGAGERGADGRHGAAVSPLPFLEDATAASRFVREELGCTCPEEVFRHVESARGGSAGGVPVAWRIDVGGRLLVYVLDGEPGAGLDERLEALVRFGRAERDRAGFNRLRVVVAGQDPEALVPWLDRVTKRLAPLDDRIHLHAVPVTAVSVPCASSSS